MLDEDKFRVMSVRLRGIWGRGYERDGMLADLPESVSSAIRYKKPLLWGLASSPLLLMILTALAKTPYAMVDDAS